MLLANASCSTILCLCFQPLLRDAYEKNPAMSKDEGKDLLERCLKVLFYRDCRAINKVYV